MDNINLPTGGAGLVAGTTDVYANLPDPALYENKLYYVSTGSGGFLAIVGKYKYPKGLYVSDGVTWTLSQIQVTVSEDAETLVNVDNWADFIDAGVSINVGDTLIYAGNLYQNKTGTNTSTPPDTDSSNWGFLSVGGLQFRTGLANPVHSEGAVFYDNTKKALSYYNESPDVTVNIGQELLIRVRNESGSLIPNGAAVYPSGVSGGNVLIGLANSRERDKCRLVGVVTHDIPDGENGYVTKLGEVGGMDTSSFSVGNIVYLSDTVDGGLTDTEPTGESFVTRIGAVKTVDAVNGSIVVDINTTELAVEVTNTNGFPPDQRTDTTLSVVDGTRTFTISPVGDSFHFYENGLKYRKTGAESVVFSDVEGPHFFYYEDAVLKEVANPVGTTIRDIILEHVLIASIYWNATDKRHSFDVYDERHGISMNPATHVYLHLTRGAQFVSGFGLGNFVIGDGSANTHAQFSVATGSYVDEDIFHVLTSPINVGTTIPIFYNLGANSYIRETSQSGFAVRTFDGTSATRLAYNQYTGGAWQLTEVASGDYVLYHIFAINGVSGRIASVMGQSSYSTLPAARIGANNEIANIITTIPLVEMIPLATIIFQTNLAYTNSINARIVQTDTGENYVDWRTSELAQGANPTSHANLTNLLLAQTGVQYGHIDDQVQILAGNKTLSGFTKFGTDGVGLKCKKLTGTTNSAEGGSTAVAHGLTGDKIVSMTAKVIQTANNGLAPEYSASAGYQFSLSHNDTNVYILNHPTNSENILSKSFVVLVWYEA